MFKMSIVLFDVVKIQLDFKTFMPFQLTSIECADFWPKCGDSEPKCGDFAPKCGDFCPKCGDFSRKWRDFGSKCGDSGCIFFCFLFFNTLDVPENQAMFLNISSTHTFCLIFVQTHSNFSFATFCYVLLHFLRFIKFLYVFVRICTFS